MLTRTGEYALRAMVCLVKNREEWPVTATQIAKETGVPHKYLSMILATLVRQGILVAARGKGGGFRMVKPPKSVYLADVLATFEPRLMPHRDQACPFGNPVCSETSPCAGHHGWSRVNETFLRFLHKTTLQKVSSEKTPPNKARPTRGPKKRK